MKILFVCTGNTCRSPMAEGIFKELTKDIPEIEIYSAGLMANNGEPISEKAVIACKEYNADISTYKAKQLTLETLNSTDYFVCMTESHTQALINAGISKHIIYTLNVNDPYGGSLELYKECCKQIYDKLFILKEDLTRTKMNYNITKMTISHTYDVAEIEKSCFSKPWSQKAIEAELSNENAHFYVLLCDNRVVGYGGMHIAMGECYIANIAVLPDFRKKGFGKAITAHLIKEAEQLNCEFISLEVRPSNTPAVSMYNMLGFEEVGIRKNFYSSPIEDGLIMTKYLNIKD